LSEYDDYDQQIDATKQVIKQAITEKENEEHQQQIEQDSVEATPTRAIEEAQKRLPPSARTNTELMQVIIEPSRDPNNAYDEYHAIKDWDLTYTKNEEQVQYLMLYGHLVTAIHELLGLPKAARAVNAEAKRYAALLRSRDFAQQREIRSFRQFVEGKEKKEKHGAGLFSRVQKEE